MAVCQNLVPLVNIKIAGKWIVIPLKMVLIGIDPYPNMIGISECLFPSANQTWLEIPPSSRCFSQRTTRPFSQGISQLATFDDPEGT
jgi:hypothetical protein